MGDCEQSLFLAEFLVDKVNVPSIRAMHTELLPVTTCVSFQILNLPPINIYQEASAENCTCLSGDSQQQVFKKGKSCLFALPSAVLDKPLESFPINMSVYKKLPPGVLPDVMLIGCHKIETKDLINSMLNRHVFKAGNPCKTIKESFKIKTATGQRVGEVTVFVRISCFGPKIVTQFQIPHNKKPYLFKGADDSPVFQCKRIPSDYVEKTGQRKCSCEPIKSFDSGQEKSRTCCPPPPTRQISSIHLSRPCCPSQRGERCPSMSLGKVEPRGEAPRPRPKDQTRMCGCSIEKKKSCNC